MRINPDFGSYITAWDAVIAQMSRGERVFDSAFFPLLFLAVAIWILATRSRPAGTVQ
jgi:alpha-1,2-mannosyltransferase